MFLPRQLHQSLSIAHQSPVPRSAVTVPKPPTSASSNNTKRDIDPTLAKEIVLSLCQLFGSQNPHTQWLGERMRSIDGRDDYVHFAALLECPFFEHTKPALSQVMLRRALASSPDEKLQVSTDGYHIRYTAPRASLRDDNTIYVEPSTTGLTTHPGMLARKLAATLPVELLPVLYTHTGGKAWAFVTLSRPISESHTSNHNIWPQDWLILTKSEWARRDTEYRFLREQALKDRAALHRSAMESMDLDPMPSKPPTMSFVPGAIVRLTNLHPSTTKPVISSFIDRSVERYLRKHPTASTTSSPGKKNTMLYIDYKRGSTTAWVRQGSREDSELILKALKNRRRAMVNAEDGRGEKLKKDSATGTGEFLPVEGSILEGEEEGRYWRTLEEAKTKKGKEKGKGRGKGRESESGSGRRDRRNSDGPGGKKEGKRHRASVDGMERGKKLRHDE